MFGYLYDDLEEIYQVLLEHPDKLLSSEEEFNEFLNLPASKEDLICFKNVCLKNELYEWAAKIHRKILNL